MRKILVAAAAVALMTGLGSSAALASPSPARSTARPAVNTPGPGLYIRSHTTVVSNNPDSGVSGTWADDDFTRYAKITRVSEVALNNCPAGSVQCWLWDYVITDSGTFTTRAGALSPRSATVLDQSLTGAMTGGTRNGQFYSNRDVAYSKIVASTVNDHGVPPVNHLHTFADWYQMFFARNGSKFASVTEGDWSWTYTLPFGANAQCPNDAYRWVDAAASGSGSISIDGDILTPDSAHCS